MVACGCIGQEALAEMTHVTGRLTDYLESAHLVSCGPSTSQDRTICPSQEFKDLSLLAQVCWHIKTLFGKCLELNQFPPPATKIKKAGWKQDLDNNDSPEESMRGNSTASLDEDEDPAFPYPDGPSHREALPATLSIIWRAMQHSGVVSFRPNLSQGARKVDNLFLWNLAQTTFIKLVQAGEYSEIDLANCPEDMIRQEIFNHAKQLQQTYCEAGWDP